MLILGYNTNGFANHRLPDAIDILADMGYRSIAITLDQHSLNPYDAQHLEQLRAIKAHLRSRGLSCVIETGARFLLDPRRRHWPTLVSALAEDRQRRLEFITRAIEIGVELNASAVSFWSGLPDPGVLPDEARKYLLECCHALLEYSAAFGMPLAFEPEPGMHIETCEHFRELCDELRHPLFGLTLDVGHVHCLADGLPHDRIVEFAEQLRVVHIEDMREGVHNHLMFGEGDMQIPPIMAALRSINYTGPTIVELSRHSHDAVNTARRAIEYLSPMLG